MFIYVLYIFNICLYILIYFLMGADVQGSVSAPLGKRINKFEISLNQIK